MSIINVTENQYNKNNLYYIQSTLSELFANTRCFIEEKEASKRDVLSINCPEHYSEIVASEIIDKVAEIIVIKYKYDYFKKTLGVGGLNAKEKELLLVGLISADLPEDKKYVIERLKGQQEIAIDGVYNFRLKALKAKWEDIVSYMPTCFISSQLRDFIGYLLENKKKRVYVDAGMVYDSHFRRLKRCSLIGGENLKIIREILLSNCGEVEIAGKIPEEDEKYIRELFGDKIYFSSGYCL